MKSLLRNQKGATHLIAILGIVLVAVVAFAGYKVMNANKDNTAKTNSSVSSSVPGKIESKGDLQQASKSLDETADSLNPSQLDSDLNSIL